MGKESIMHTTNDRRTFLLFIGFWLAGCLTGVGIALMVMANV